MAPRRFALVSPDGVECGVLTMDEASRRFDERARATLRTDRFVKWLPAVCPDGVFLEAYDAGDAPAQAVPGFPRFALRVLDSE
jgi:hypothetical protein